MQSQWEQRKGWSIGPGDEVGLWLGHKTGCPEATSMAAGYKGEKIQGETERHREVSVILCQVFSELASV